MYNNAGVAVVKSKVVGLAPAWEKLLICDTLFSERFKNLFKLIMISQMAKFCRIWSH
jgi:hypothetical protein